MKYIFTILLISSLFSIGIAQETEIFYENKGEQVLVFAKNPHHCPVSVKLKLTLTNMKAHMNGTEDIFVVPSLQDKYYLTTIERISRTRDSYYHTEFESKYGDVTLINDGQSHIYDLPYKAGKKVMVHQGYNGRYSHKGVNALDFNMNEGEDIFAARGGIVIEVVEHNKSGCNSPSCHRYNNIIVIYHNDGSLAVYSHLKYNGAKVSEGDLVEQGQFIGLSGATGYASGPHLHFMVLHSKFGDNITLQTQFNTMNGVQFLNERENYTKPL